MLIGTWRELKRACNNIDESLLDSGVIIKFEDKKYTIKAITMDNGVPVVKSAYRLPDWNSIPK